MDLLQYVLDQEQSGIDALLAAQAERTKWIMGGNYLRIDYKDHSGKIVDTHPHIQTLIKRLAQSGLMISRQQEILNGCQHDTALKYLECLQHSHRLENLVDIGLVNDCSFSF